MVGNISNNYLNNPSLTLFAAMESAPRNIQVRPLSSSTMVVTWEPPETPNGQITVSGHSDWSGHSFISPFSAIFQGYKVYYTTDPTQSEQSWESQVVDNSELTTISELSK